MDISIPIILKAIKDALNFSIGTYLIISIISAAVLFVPIEYLELIKIDFLRNNWGNYFGTALFLASVILVFKLITGFLFFITKKWYIFRFNKNLPKIIETLKPLEKRYLKEYIDRNAASLEFDDADDIPRVLSEKNILILRNQVSKNNCIGYEIDPDVDKLIRSKPDLLSGARGEIYKSPIMKLLEQSATYDKLGL